MKVKFLKEYIFNFEKLENNIKEPKELILLENSEINRLKHNTFLKTNKKYFKVKRGHIYLIDFLYNIGCEIRGEHYCVVLSSVGELANIIPLTSKNNSNINKVSLGVIPEINEKESYAVYNQITTVDKSRLRRIKKKNLKLNSNQLNLIDSALINLLTKNT